MNIPKISAIVSAYYAEEYLEGRLSNLYDQINLDGNQAHDVIDLEIVIICETGSHEEKIAREFTFRHPDAKVVICETEGIPTIYAAWNIGIERASGDLITNANSDDRLYPEALGKMAGELLRRKDFSVCYANVHIVTEIDAEPVDHFDWIEGGFEQLLKGCFLGPMPIWRKSLHVKHGLFDPEMQSAGDYEFWLRIAKAGERFYKMRDNFTCGAYLKRGDSAEHRKPVLSVWETARARSRYSTIGG